MMASSNVVRARLRTLWRRFEDYWRIWQLQRNGMNFAPALAADIPSPNANESSTSSSVLESLLSPWLMAVPRNRRSVEKRRKRRFGYPWFQQTYLKKNIIVCLNCGHHHEADTICGNCYSLVREETEAMRQAMGVDTYRYDHPRTEVAYVYEGEDKIAPMYKGKCLVEMKKKRPAWFPPHLMTKV